MSAERPEVGETWIKGSFPLPTVAEVVSIDGDMLTVRHAGRRRALAVQWFIDQGFQREDVHEASLREFVHGKEVE